MKYNIFMLLALSATMVWTSCQKETLKDDSQAKEPGQTYTFTVDASKGVGTKALELVDNTATGGTETLLAYWVDGEKVAVYFGGNHIGDLTATVDPDDNSKAKLSGSLNTVDGISNGSSLDLVFPRAEWDYTGQNGAAPTIAGAMAKNYDYALATVTVASVNATTKTVTASAASFVNQQSIFRFAFNTAGTPVVVKELTLSSYYNKMVQTRSYGNGEWTSTYGSLTVVPETATSAPLYIASRNEKTSGGDSYYMFIVSDDNSLYAGRQSIPERVIKESKFASATNISVQKVTITKKTGNATFAF